MELNHAMERWQQEQRTAALRFELGVSRAAEAHARALAASLASAASRRHVLPAAALLFGVVILFMKLVALMQRPLLPFAVTAIATAAAPETMRSLAGLVYRQGRFLLHYGAEQMAALSAQTADARLPASVVSGGQGRKALPSREQGRHDPD